MVKRPYLVVALCLITAGCIGAADSDAENVGPADELVLVPSPIALAAEDITALYPLLTEASFPVDARLIAPSELGRGSLPLASQATLQRVLDTSFQGVNADFVKSLFTRTPYASFRVVGVRVDPCLSAVPVAPESWRTSPRCARQLRLSVQAFTSLEGIPQPADHTFHLLYNLTGAEFGEVISELRNMRVPLPSATRVLGPSDALRNATYRRAMRALILRYVSEQNLVQVTHTGLTGLSIWEMAGAVVQSYGAGHGAPPVGPLRLRSTSPQTTEGIIASGNEFGSVNERVFTRATIPELADGRFLNSSWFVGYDQPPFDAPADFVPPSDRELRDVFAAMQALEEPAVHTPFTTTCASCHLAGTSMRWANEYFAGRRGRQDQRDLLPAPRAARITRAASVLTADTEQFNMRMFGYSVRSSPTITVRVLNETNDILEFLNS